MVFVLHKVTIQKQCRNKIALVRSHIRSLEWSGASVSHQCISMTAVLSFQEALNGFLEEKGKTHNRLTTLTIQLQREFNFNQRQALCLKSLIRRINLEVLFILTTQG